MDQNNQDQEIELYTIDDIQRIFKIGRTKAYQLLNSNGFPTLKLNRKLYVSRDKLEEWVAKNSGKTHKF